MPRDVMPELSVRSKSSPVGGIGVKAYITGSVVPAVKIGSGKGRKRRVAIPEPPRSAKRSK